MSKKSKNIWDKVRSEIAGGTFPPVFIAADGKLALDGVGATLPQEIADLYPADVRQSAQEKRDLVIAAQAAESLRFTEEMKAAEARRQQVIETFRHKRNWRLNGLYVEEFSERYTYEEIRQWIDCESYVLRHNGPSVSIVCDRGDVGEFCLDVSGHFDNVCNDNVRTPSFSEMAKRLQAFVFERRANASDKN